MCSQQYGPTIFCVHSSNESSLWSRFSFCLKWISSKHVINTRILRDITLIRKQLQHTSNTLHFGMVQRECHIIIELFVELLLESRTAKNNNKQQLWHAAHKTPRKLRKLLWLVWAWYGGKSEQSDMAKRQIVIIEEEITKNKLLDGCEKKNEDSTRTLVNFVFYLKLKTIRNLLHFLGFIK